ncbi:MAG: hypothetical protein AB8B56_04560 [Crocinitomicaceae bacterium]
MRALSKMGSAFLCCTASCAITTYLLQNQKFLGEICVNPNLPELEKQQKYQENLLDIPIINYAMGKLKNTQYYDLNMNRILELEESKNN